MMFKCNDCGNTTSYPLIFTEEDETYYVCGKCGSESMDIIDEAEEDQ